MKKILILVLMLTVVCIGSNAFAVEDQAGRSSIGIVGGGIFPSDSDIDDTFYIGGNYSYSINNYFALGAEVGYTLWEDELNGISYGDVRAVPLLADFYLRYPIDAGENTLIPYAIGGVGIIFWDYDESSLLELFGISVDMDTELGLKLGGGCDFLISENFALNLEGSYLWSDANATVAAAGTVAAAEIDTDSWLITGGVKFYF